PPHLIASHNIEADIWRRRAAVARGATARMFFRMQAAKMVRFERRAFRRAAAVTAVSVGDCAAALRMGARRTAMVANGVDLEQFQPAPGKEVAGRLLFLGALDWFANQDAVLHFVQATLPLIRARRPGAHLQVVGRRPAEALRRRLSGQPGVELAGEVEDVRPYLAAAAVVVVPLRIGGGSRIKIIEALAMEKAVVATTVGAEGLEVRPGTHLLLADEPQQFARLTAQLLATPAQAAQLGRTGGRWVREHHNWDDAARALERAWLAAAAGGRG
ncbi:MAG: glycosyltransferase family 4 protein, partial [Terriglobales bacterium]